MQPYMLIPQQGAEAVDDRIRLGLEAQLAGKNDEADRNYRLALQIDPRNPVATNNFAILQAQKGDLNEGLLGLERGILFDEKLASLHMNLGLMRMQAGRMEEALESGRKAVELNANENTRFMLALICGTAGLVHEAIDLYNKIIDEKPDHVPAASNACFAQTLVFSTPADLLKQRQRCYNVMAFKGQKRPHRIDTTWPRPLRVGYVGGDFKIHSASHIFGNVVLDHDHNAVLPYLYSSLPVSDVDYMTQLFKKAAGDRWRNIDGKSDDEAEEMIRADKIDILVDLAAHTGGGRLALFSRKPAPVQITAWGFAHGTGLPEIDYFFADPVSVPESERGNFSEKIYDLPSLLTYRVPPYDLSDGGRIPLQQNGFITFGVSSRYEKLSPECLKVFAEILRRVPDSVLRLKDMAYNRPYSIKRVTSLMPDIAPERLHFLIGTDHIEHMKAHRAADMALDPFPHCGGVVSLEQLYMGVPIVTLYGTQPSGRNTSSVLTAIGRTGWIAKTPEEYVEIAVALADDVKGLREARKSLRSELLNSPVVKGYREAVEKAYQDIWQRKLAE